MFYILHPLLNPHMLFGEILSNWQSSAIPARETQCGLSLCDGAEPASSCFPEVPQEAVYLSKHLHFAWPGFPLSLYPVAVAKSQR
jgi:hypothetical protein